MVSWHLCLYIAKTYALPIRRLSRLFIVVPDFVEVIFVQLPDEAGKVAVLKVFRKDVLCEFFVL